MTDAFQNGTSRDSAGMPIASTKYRPFTPINLSDRTWPGKVIDKAP